MLRFCVCSFVLSATSSISSSSFWAGINWTIQLFDEILNFNSKKSNSNTRIAVGYISFLRSLLMFVITFPLSVLVSFLEFFLFEPHRTVISEWDACIYHCGKAIAVLMPAMEICTYILFDSFLIIFVRGNIRGFNCLEINRNESDENKQFECNLDSALGGLKFAFEFDTHELFTSTATTIENVTRSRCSLFLSFLRLIPSMKANVI